MDKFAQAVKSRTTPWLGRIHSRKLLLLYSVPSSFQNDCRIINAHKITHVDNSLPSDTESLLEEPEFSLEAFVEVAGLPV